jgi:hypothetical protein
MFFFKKIKKSLKLDYIYIFTLITYSAILGFTYSKYHTDPWHWGSIVGDAIDYINGFKLFKEIALLWGPGLPILLATINKFFNVNYYSIGIITSITYSLNLLLSFIIIKKLSDQVIAIVMSFCIFCLVPYPQTPWPDFYSGLCLTISCYFLTIRTKNNLIIFISSLFLSFSIILRNTYLLGIIPTIIFFCIFFYVKKKKLPALFKKYFYFFFAIITIVTLILLKQNNLILWYEQGIGRINEYQDQDNLIYNYKIDPFIYSLIKFIYHIFFPARSEARYYLIFFLLNLGFLFIILFKIKIFNKTLYINNNIIFFSILGLFGIFQSANQYEVWRNINSSISIFFVVAYFFYKFVKKTKYRLIINIGIVILFIPLFPRNHGGFDYYKGTNYFPIKGYFVNEKVWNDSEFKTDEELYFKSSIIFFNNHKFNKEHLEYYNEVRSLICTYDKIINYTFDRTLVYICDKKNNIISSTTNNLSKPTFNGTFLEYHFVNNNINLNEIVIADKRFVNHNLRLLKKINIPKYMRYTKSDIFMRYFEDEIFLYVRN